MLHLRIVKVICRNLDAKVRILSDFITNNIHILKPSILHGGFLLVLIWDDVEPLAQIGLIDGSSEDDLICAFRCSCDDVVFVFLEELMDLRFDG